MVWKSIAVCLFIVLSSMNACDSLPKGMSKKVSPTGGTPIDEQTWIPTGTPGLENPCKNGQGTFPDVLFFDGGVWCTVQRNRTQFIAKIAKDLTTISLTSFQLNEGTLSFGRLGVANNQLWIAYANHSTAGNFDELILRNVATGATENLGTTVGMFPAIMGYGYLAYIRPGYAHLRYITGGEISWEPVDTSQGFNRILSTGEWQLTDANRNIFNWGLKPCWTDDYIGAEDFNDNGLLVQYRGGTPIRIFVGRRAFDPRCTQVPGGAVFAVWGNGYPVDMTVLTPSNF